MGGNISETIFLIRDNLESTKQAILKGIANYMGIGVPSPIKPTAPGVNTEIYQFTYNGSRGSVFYNPDNGQPKPHFIFETDNPDLGRKVKEIIQKYR